ncbi:MAG TPA: Mut7-C RNAse domain-containing protein [Candidatus Nitrosopolaris sp.]|nr:Mut7-C RNAse domain-containing protein [Candidatus Nitrosopolaris sp.]
MERLLAKNVGARKSLVKSKPAFVADAMLGSVARKLRFYGLDTLYIADSSDDEIIAIGIKQNRVILTCDKDMYRRIMKTGAQGILLNGSNDLENIAQTFSSFGMLLGPYIDISSRCSMCNGLLSDVSYAEVKGKIHFNIINRHTRFFECRKCNKLFWEGSHYLSLGDLSKRIDRQIMEWLGKNNSVTPDIITADRKKS